MVKLHDWYYLSPVMVFMPLILLFHENKKSFLWLGIIRGIFFYSGNIQYVIYSLFFEFAYLLIKSTKKWTEYLYSLLISFIIALPNLILLFLMSSVSSREFSIVGYFTSNIVNPLGLFIGNFWPSSYYYISLFLFTGFIFMIIKKKYTPYVKLSILSILISFGVFGIIYALFVIVPVWQNFLHPIKLMVFSALFISISGAQYLSKVKKYHNLFLIFTILIIIVIIPKYSNTLNLPRDALHVDIYENGRVISFMQSETYENKYITQNYASLSKAYHVTGYEHLMPKLNRYVVPIDRFGKPLIHNPEINVDLLSEYGVRRIITDGIEIEDLKLIQKTIEENYVIYENTNARSFVFTENQDVAYYELPNGIGFSSDFDKDTLVVYTNLFHDSYKAYIDGEVAGLTKDEYGRINLMVPAGTHNIKIVYKRDIFWISGLIALLVLIPLIILRKIILKKLNPIVACVIEFTSKTIKTCLKYWHLVLLVIMIIYSGFIYLSLEKQGFIQAADGCKLDTSLFGCVAKNYEQVKQKKMCNYLQENHIKYTIVGEVTKICQDNQALT